MNDDLKKMTTEQLINAYIDDELSPRHKTELKRLMKHDKAFADKVRFMHRQRQVYSELPTEKAPSHLLNDIKASIERRALLDDYQLGAEDFSGTRHLFARHFASAAAVLLLVGFLGYIVWKVIAPVEVSTDQKPMIAKVDNQSLQMDQPVMEEIAPKPKASVMSVRKSGKLSTFAIAGDSMQSSPEPLFAQLKMLVSDPVTANNLFSQAIYNNNLIDSTTIKRDAGKTVYNIKASKPQIIALMHDTGLAWKDVQLSQFSLAGDEFGDYVVVDNVNKDQLLDIFNQSDASKRELFCKDIAQANRVFAQMPGKALNTELENRGSFVPEIVTPVLTSKVSKTGDAKNKEPKNINLKLVISEF